ncbi:MAG: sulfatase-like hydrolase/transferase, partial [Solirubrobacterales bacterium]
MIGETFIRRPLIRAIGLLLLGLVLALLSVFRPEGASASTRPNFVLIQLDDFANLHLDGTWVDSTGQVRPNMPLTSEAMLSNGVRFTRYLAPNPICAPSRASLLSGQYADNNGVLAVGGPNGGWDAFRNNEILDRNLAVWLRNGGYRTMQFGKFMNFYMEPDGYPTQVPSRWRLAKSSSWISTKFGRVEAEAPSGRKTESRASTSPSRS